MLDVIKETLIDALKLLPFLFFTYLLLEYLEHKTTNKVKQLINKSNNSGPLVGSILGCAPQCGFSVSAANLYSNGLITLGTLIAIFLSTSDEMIPIILSSGSNFLLIFQVMGIKVIVGIIIGYLIDFIIKNNKKKLCEEITSEDHHNCHEHCNNNLFVAAIKHTLSIFIFIIIISFCLNLLIYTIGEDKLSSFLEKSAFIGPLLASIIGLIPNCASSVIITELYLNSTITFGTLIAGSLTASGIGIAVLFKVNKNIKENFKIMAILFITGVLVGILIDFINLIIK